MAYQVENKFTLTSTKYKVLLEINPNPNNTNDKISAVMISLKCDPNVVNKIQFDASHISFENTGARISETASELGLTVLRGKCAAVASSLTGKGFEYSSSSRILTVRYA